MEPSLEVGQKSRPQTVLHVNDSLGPIERFLGSG